MNTKKIKNQLAEDHEMVNLPFDFKTESKRVKFTCPEINNFGIDELKKMLEIEVWEGSSLLDSEILTAWAENQSQIEILEHMKYDIDKTIKYLKEGIDSINDYTLITKLWGR
tara:strand:- start:123 stop:458 length:336 start_codon:yes stop_codon:yes gene_type:complete